jgi:hypothetical protein
LQLVGGVYPPTWLLLFAAAETPMFQTGCLGLTQGHCPTLWVLVQVDCATCGCSLQSSMFCCYESSWSMQHKLQMGYALCGRQLVAPCETQTGLSLSTHNNPFYQGCSQGCMLWAFECAWSLAVRLFCLLGCAVFWRVQNRGSPYGVCMPGTVVCCVLGLGCCSFNSMLGGCASAPC